MTTQSDDAFALWRAFAQAYSMVRLEMIEAADALALAPDRLRSALLGASAWRAVASRMELQCRTRTSDPFTWITHRVASCRTPPTVAIAATDDLRSALEQLPRLVRLSASLRILVLLHHSGRDVLGNGVASERRKVIRSLQAAGAGAGGGVAVPDLCCGLVIEDGPRPARSAHGFVIREQHAADR